MSRRYLSIRTDISAAADVATKLANKRTFTIAPWKVANVMRSRESRLNAATERKYFKTLAGYKQERNYGATWILRWSAIIFLLFPWDILSRIQVPSSFSESHYGHYLNIKKKSVTNRNKVSGFYRSYLNITDQYDLFNQWTFVTFN